MANTLLPLPPPLAATRSALSRWHAAVLAAATLATTGCSASVEPPLPAAASQTSAEAAPAKTDEPAPEGPLTKKAIERVIEAHFDSFQACYDAGLKRDAKLHGKVMARPAHRRRWLPRAQRGCRIGRCLTRAW